MGSCWYYTGVDETGGEQCVYCSNKSACDGHDYSDDPCPSSCFFASELTKHVIAKSAGDAVVQVSAHPGVLIASDFRDVILRQSALGREAVDLYAAHARTAIKGLRTRPKLLLRALRLLTTGILLAQDMLRAHLLKGRGGAFRLQNTTVREALEVARDLGKIVHTKEFDHLVSRVEWFFKRILEFLGAKKPRSHTRVMTSRSTKTVKRPRRKKG
jgi:hypothetical protein